MDQMPLVSSASSAITVLVPTTALTLQSLVNLKSRVTWKSLSEY
jgi:hypothetical protein